MQGDFIPPLALVFFRVFGAGILFWLIHTIFIKERINKKDVPYFLLCSFVGIVLSQNIFLMGLEKTPAINASLLISTTPIIVTIFSVLILKDILTKNKILGLVLAAFGAGTLVLSRGNLDLNDDYFLGNFLIFLNAVTYGLYLVLIKPLLFKYNPLTVIKWVFTFSTPFILLISYNDLTQIKWSAFTGYAWFGLIYVVIFATFCTYLFNAYAIKMLSPVIAGLYLYLQPFFTTIFAISFGKDMLTPIKAVAGILILTGLYFVIKKTYPRNTEQNL